MSLMVKGKFKEALKKSKELEKKKVRTLGQLEKSDDEFEEEKNILKRAIGKLYKRGKKKRKKGEKRKRKR